MTNKEVIALELVYLALVIANIVVPVLNLLSLSPYNHLFFWAGPQ